jgi:2-oxoisovalerate dehydrogenase E1 component alpha subunit
VNSKFTSEMIFTQPSAFPTIPTYRVIDSDGVHVGEPNRFPEVSDDEVVSWYKNMLTGAFHSWVDIAVACFADNKLQ